MMLVIGFLERKPPTSEVHVGRGGGQGRGEELFEGRPRNGKAIFSCQHWGSESLCPHGRGPGGSGGTLRDPRAAGVCSPPFSLAEATRIQPISEGGSQVLGAFMGDKAGD